MIEKERVFDAIQKNALKELQDVKVAKKPKPDYVKDIIVAMLGDADFREEFGKLDLSQRQEQVIGVLDEVVQETLKGKSDFLDVLTDVKNAENKVLAFESDLKNKPHLSAAVDILQPLFDSLRQYYKLKKDTSTTASFQALIENKLTGQSEKIKAFFKNEQKILGDLFDKGLGSVEIEEVRRMMDVVRASFVWQPDLHPVKQEARKPQGTAFSEEDVKNAEVSYGAMAKILIWPLNQGINAILTQFIDANNQSAELIGRRINLLKERSEQTGNLYDKALADIVKHFNSLQVFGIFVKGKTIDFDRCVLNPDDALGTSGSKLRSGTGMQNYQTFASELTNDSDPKDRIPSVYAQAIVPLQELVKKVFRTKTSQWFASGTDWQNANVLFERMVEWLCDENEIKSHINEIAAADQMSKVQVAKAYIEGSKLDPNGEELDHLGKYIVAMLHFDPFENGQNTEEYLKWRELLEPLQAYLKDGLEEAYRDYENPEAEIKQFRKLVADMAQADSALKDLKSSAAVEAYGKQLSAFKNAQGIVKFKEEQPQVWLSKLAYKVGKGIDEGKYASGLAWVKMPRDLMSAKGDIAKEVIQRQKRIDRYINYTFNNGSAAEKLKMLKWRPKNYAAGLPNIDVFLDMAAKYPEYSINADNYLSSFEALNKLYDQASLCWSEDKTEEFSKLSEVDFFSKVSELISTTKSLGAMATSFAGVIPKVGEYKEMRESIIDAIRATIDVYIIYLFSQVKAEQGLKAKLLPAKFGMPEYHDRYELLQMAVDRELGTYSSFYDMTAAYDVEMWTRAKESCLNQIQMVDEERQKLGASNYNEAQLKSMEESGDSNQEELAAKIKSLNDRLKRLSDRKTEIYQGQIDGNYIASMTDLLLATAYDPSFKRTAHLSPQQSLLNYNLGIRKDQGMPTAQMGKLPHGLDDPVKWPYAKKSDTSVTEKK